MPQLPASVKGSELKRRLVELASTTRPDRPQDVYVTSSTGHQLADGGGSGVAWRDDRNRKLKAQFSSSRSGVVGLKRKANDISTGHDDELKHTGEKTKSEPDDSTMLAAKPTTQAESTPPKQLFRGCTIYINGNTSLSGISDIELKRLLSSHGALVSYHLARRQVTHVILTNPSAASSSSSSRSQSSTAVLSKGVSSSGPAVLASRKLELETKGRIKSKIHYVSVEWALASIKEGKRLAETKYPVVPLREARQSTLMDCKKVKSSQRSISDMMMKKV